MSPVRLFKTSAVAVLRVDNPPVNALSQAVRAGLLAGLSEAESDPDIIALVLVGCGRAFIAGADIKEFGKPLKQPFLPEVCARLERSDLLIVASLHGVSLGGGLEIALAAHYRIAQPDARMGLPEVTLGLIPGAGGTQRLPRLIGVEAAVDMITTGRQIGAREAQALGVVDACRAGDSEEVGIAYAETLITEGAGPRRLCDVARPQPANWQALAAKIAAKAKGRIAPLKALEAIKASTDAPFSEAIATEREIFLELMQSDQRACLMHAFFAERTASAPPQLSKPPVTIGSVGVVGGGTMGAGIAANALLSGFEVALIEAEHAALVQAERRITGHLQGALKRGKIGPEQLDKMLSASLSLATDLDELAKTDLVIEAIYEDLEAKRAVFRRIDAVCHPDTVLATNTSYLDIDAIADVTQRPQQVIGLHYFSPAHVMKLLEVVVTPRTAPVVVAVAFEFAKKAGKLAVQAGNCDGFIGNRILRSCRAAADHMVLCGATPQDVDAAMRAFGFAMGPYEVADMAGLDIAWAMRKRRASAGRGQDTPVQFADQLCEEGYFGRKTNAGYYVYAPDQPVAAHERAQEIIAQERAAKGITARHHGVEEIQNRYLAAMVNEAANILQEGVARRPSDIDVVLMLGYGFPRHLGGPCKWADMRGLAHVMAEIDACAADSRAILKPSGFLRDMVRQRQTFAHLNSPAD